MKFCQINVLFLPSSGCGQCRCYGFLFQQSLLRLSYSGLFG